jgi:polyisoprenoid-binding protein YceI
MNKWVKRALIAVPVLVALFFGAILVYVNFINDPEDPFDETDLAAVFEVSDTTAVAASVETAADPSTTSVSASPGTIAGAPGTIDGRWAVDASQSEFGYRVEEVLSGVNTTATGRGREIEGSISVAGSSVTDGTFTIQVASITSDQSNRDSQFRGRVMETDEFPTATFTLTAPIEFGDEPAPGEQITAPATGDLTLHGVTNEVTFDVTAQTDGSTIGVLGNIPIVFADYDIDNPSNNVVTTEDNGLLEFVLVFTPG